MGGCTSSPSAPQSTANTAKDQQQPVKEAVAAAASTQATQKPEPLFGLMQDQPLLVSSILRFAERYHSTGQIVSKRVEGDIHRYTYKVMAARTRQLANALDRLSLKVGDRVATLAWNGYRHVELYYGISGSGRVTHTLNPRLPPDQLIYIANHAEDQVLCFDMTFINLIKEVASKLTSVKQFVALCDADALPADSGIPGLRSYEEWIGAESSDYEWPVLDERLACTLCYTSGTTGAAKGCLYSHRSTVIHAFAGALPDALSISAREVILPVVPQFHVNAWGLVYSGPMTGAKLVLPGPQLNGEAVYKLMEAEKVTFAAGVPTVWQMLLGYVQQNNLKFSTLRRTVIGGSACPPAMMKTFKEQYNVDVIHAWGMTEMSPLGSIGSLKSEHFELPWDEQFKLLMKQGRPPFGVEMKIVDEQGAELPWDGKTSGDLLVRGPWVVKAYFKSEGGNILRDGWFPTGDVANIDPDGFMQITDRSKDLIKSAGEWLSSIDIENIAQAHPAVAMAACIGMKHPKWDERPIIVVVKKPNAEVTGEELLAFYKDKVAKWQIPDDVVFVESIPLGATGKMQKVKVREMLKDYVLPSLRQEANSASPNDDATAATTTNGNQTTPSQ